MTEVVKTVAEEVAARIDRRRFVRTVSSRLFMGFALVTAGGGLGLVKASLGRAATYCEPTGPGCPTGCGPSMCCNNGGRGSGCNCGTGGSCVNNGSHCHGFAGTWGGSSCWTCYTTGWYQCLQCMCRQYTTCCDCATTGCNDSSGHCISYYSGVQKGCANGVVTDTIVATPPVAGAVSE